MTQDVHKKTRTTVIDSSDALSLPDFGELWRKRELLWIMVVSQVRSKYRQRALGILWALLQPLIFLVLFTVIFGGLAKVDTGEKPYPLFAMAALLPWQYFQRLLMDTTNSLVMAVHVLSKIYIPRLLILLVPSGPAILDFVIGIFVLIGLFVYYGFAPPLMIFVAFPFFLLLATSLAISVGLWVSVVNVTFRDVAAVLPVFLQVLFYAAPIVYPVDMVPEQYRAVYEAMPTTVIVEGFRYAFLGGDAPSMINIILCVGIIALIALPGLFFFQRVSQTMVDRL